MLAKKARRENPSKRGSEQREKTYSQELKQAGSKIEVHEVVQLLDGNKAKLQQDH